MEKSPNGLNGGTHGKDNNIQSVQKNSDVDATKLQPTNGLINTTTEPDTSVVTEEQDSHNIPQKPEPEERQEHALPVDEQRKSPQRPLEGPRLDDEAPTPRNDDLVPEHAQEMPNIAENRSMEHEVLAEQNETQEIQLQPGTSPEVEEHPTHEHEAPELRAEDNTPTSHFDNGSIQKPEEEEQTETTELPEKSNVIEQTQAPVSIPEKRQTRRSPAAGRVSPEDNESQEGEDQKAGNAIKESQTTRKLPSRASKRRKVQSEKEHVEPEHDEVRKGEALRDPQESISANHDLESDNFPQQRSKRPRKQKPATKSSDQIHSAVEEEGAASAATASGASNAPKRRRRGRQLPLEEENVTTEPDKEEEHPNQPDNKESHDAETERRPQSKRPTTRQTRPRQPRGETVPITVHRFTNFSSLDINVAAAGDESGEEENAEEESADELTTRRKTTKLPTRGGVNPADVLSQMSRETIEKMLNKLKDGIANETTDGTRRSEWTRKRKAIEAFGTELEGRLFELSEVLDSNFVLSSQLRRSKREVTDLRNRVHHARKEREIVALQMDAARMKYMNDEDERMVCTLSPLSPTF